MPDEKLINLCREIGMERNPIKLAKLIEDLIALLHEEQDTIRTIIRERLSKTVGGAVLAYSGSMYNCGLPRGIKSRGLCAALQLPPVAVRTPPWAPLCLPAGKIRTCDHAR